MHFVMQGTANLFLRLTNDLSIFIDVRISRDFFSKLSKFIQIWGASCRYRFEQMVRCYAMLVLSFVPPIWRSNGVNKAARWNSTAPDVGVFLGCHSILLVNNCDTRGWFNFFKVFHPPFGKDSQFDEHIFQMGWFNHQLGDIWSPHFCDIFRQFLEWSWNLQTCSHKVKWRKAVMWRIWATLQRVSVDVVADLCTNYTIINHHLCS